MGRDISLMVSAKDNYTNTISKMSQITRTFTSDMAGCQQKLELLNKNKTTLQVDAARAKNELKDAQKAFAQTGDEASRLQMEAAQADYNNIASNLKLVSDQAKQTEKDMQGLTDDLSRAQNRAGSGGAKGTSDIGKLASAGLTKMLGDTVSQISSSLISSEFGSETGQLINSVISGAASGAAIGSIIPGIGTVVGAGVGALSGAAEGAIQIFNARDDAFKSVVKDLYDSAQNTLDATLTAGSTLAGGRETSLISWTTLLGSKEKAESFLGTLKNMANTTPFLYEDLEGMAKSLKTFGYSADEIMPTLTAIGDAGAALGMSASDMETVATALGRMRVTDKTTTEYLNLLLERGIPAYDYLAQAMGVTKSEVQDMITKGLIPGSQAAQILSDALETAYDGSMKLQSTTFEGLSSTVEGLQNELSNAMGEGFNTARKQGLSDEVDFLSGETGQKMQDAYNMIGQWKASLQNEQEDLERSAMTGVMEGISDDVSSKFNSDQLSRLTEMHDQYLAAKDKYAAGDEAAGAEMGALIAEAQVIAQNKYMDSDGYKLQQEANITLAQNIGEDAATNEAYYDSGYTLGLQLSKGIVAAIGANMPDTGDMTMWLQDVDTAYGSGSPGKGNAWGLDRVPYDNYPARLHEGERVLTAAQARKLNGTGVVQPVISGNNFYIREEADIEKTARELVRQMSLAALVS